MNRHERRSGLVILLVAFGLFEFAVQTMVASTDPPSAAFSAMSLALVLSFLGAGYVARKRGHGSAWALLGVLNWIGIIVAFCLKDRRKAEPDRQSTAPVSKAPVEHLLLNAGFKKETLDRDTHIYTRPWTPPSEPWLAPLLEAGFRNDILDHQPYEEALNQAVQEGEQAIPVLLRHLGQAEYVAFALGRIGGTAALEALGKELLSNDWQRAAAAARGLGLSKDPAAEPYLKRAIGGPLHRTVAEVHQAIESAMNALNNSAAERETPGVDRENIWRQIQSIKSRHPDTPEGRRAREEALGVCRAIMRELPSLQVRVPGQDFPPNEAKARAWGSLAPHIYYLLNPDTNDMNRPCPEARQCFEEALKLERGDSFWETSISNVSPRPATPQPKAQAEPSCPAIPTPNVQGLLHEILEHASVVMGDGLRQGRLDRLIVCGPGAVPVIEAAIRSAIRDGEHASTFENAGLLCETVGKIGGHAAFDVLKRFALQDSKVSEYRYIRTGAVRGLAHLRDKRAAAVLTRVSERFGLDSLVSEAFHAIGQEMPQPTMPASIPTWVGEAKTWEQIAEAFIATLVPTKAPDFKGFSEMVSGFDGKRRHGAWHMVAFGYRKAGDGRTASQCFVEALLQDTDPALSSTAWGLIELPAGGPDLTAVRERLKVAAGGCSGSRELALELQAALGRPGASPPSDNSPACRDEPKVDGPSQAHLAEEVQSCG